MYVQGKGGRLTPIAPQLGSIGVPPRQVKLTPTPPTKKIFLDP